jgi:CRISPR-associated protein Cmr1
MELVIKTSTPLWTGGVDTKVDRVHETGIVGSLRWWMEAFVRGLGGQVNDPTQNERSGFDRKNYDESTAVDERARLRDAGLCDVSQIFGATGWRRRFRLDIRDSTSPDNAVSPRIEIKHSYTDKEGKTKTRTSTWHFSNKPRSGQLAIQIQSLAQDFQPQVMAGLIQFVADWAAIGARAQMGFGVIEPVNERIETRTLYDWLIATAGNQLYPNLPSLKNIFLAQIKPKDSDHSFIEQTTFNLKYDLRRLFADDQKLRHFIMGTVKDGRMASKVKISRPYGDSVIRVWGWIPEKAGVYTSSWNRNTVVDAIYQHLKTNYTLQVWREMNSTRDTIAPSISEAQVFLHNLLGLKEDGDGA